jgi:hypothetical protein
VAVAIALLALVWQMMSFRLGGRRLRVYLQVGSDKRDDGEWEEYAAVVVVNVGRIPATVRSLQITYRRGLPSPSWH